MAYLATLPGARDTLIGDANTDGTAWMYAVAGLHPLWTHYDYPVQQGPGYHRYILWAYADDADTDPRVAEAVRALGVRYVMTSMPVVREFVMPDGLVALDKSRSWAKIYDNGGARIYEWRGGAVSCLRTSVDKGEIRRRGDDDEYQHRRRRHRDHQWSRSDGSDQQDDDSDGRSVTDLVEQPAKVMRIGTMIKQLLEEVRAAPLDDASRNRLRAIHATSIRELEDGLAPELREELERLTLPFGENAHTVGRGVADRAGTARRVARRPVPRHPDRVVRPADGCPHATRAHAPGRAAAGHRDAGAATRRRATAPASTCSRGPVSLTDSTAGAVSIRTQGAWVEFPIFDAKSRSLKKTFLGKAGGTIGRNTVQRPGHRGAAGHHPFAGHSVTASGWSGTTAQASRRCCACCPDLRADPRQGRRKRPCRTDFRPGRGHGPGDLRIREHHHPRIVPR